MVLLVHTSIRAGGCVQPLAGYKLRTAAQGFHSELLGAEAEERLLEFLTAVMSGDIALQKLDGILPLATAA